MGVATVTLPSGFKTPDFDVSMLPLRQLSCFFEAMAIFRDYSALQFQLMLASLISNVHIEQVLSDRGIEPGPHVCWTHFKPELL